VLQPAWEAQAILHFAGVPFVVTHSSYPLVPRAGWLPLLVDKRRVVRGEAVIPHVCDVDGDGTFRVAPPSPRAAASDADGSGQGGASEGGAGGSRPGTGAATSSDTDAASSALLSMVHYELDVLWRRWRWLHRRARTEAVVESQLSPQWMAPARWIALRIVSRAARHRVECNALECGATSEATVVRRVVRCYSALAAHLARVRAETGGEFFGGARPGPLDAAVFGHIATVEADAERARQLGAAVRQRLERDTAQRAQRAAAAVAKKKKKNAARAAGSGADDGAALGDRDATALLLGKDLDAILAESFGTLTAHCEAIRRRWFVDGALRGAVGSAGAGSGGGQAKPAAKPAERWSAYAAPEKEAATGSDASKEAAAAATAPGNAELVSARQWFAFTASASALFIVLYHTPLLDWVRGASKE
jgi:hypothetical protein